MELPERLLTVSHARPGIKKLIEQVSATKKASGESNPVPWFEIWVLVHLGPKKQL
jgi:hypothetical protein